MSAQTAPPVHLAHPASLESQEKKDTRGHQGKMGKTATKWDEITTNLLVMIWQRPQMLGLLQKCVSPIY